jgi:hypothetical protein
MPDPLPSLAADDSHTRTVYIQGFSGELAVEDVHELVAKWGLCSLSAEVIVGWGLCRRFVLDDCGGVCKGLLAGCAASPPDDDACWRNAVYFIRVMHHGFMARARGLIDGTCARLD